MKSGSEESIPPPAPESKPYGIWAAELISESAVMQLCHLAESEFKSPDEVYETVTAIHPEFDIRVTVTFDQQGRWKELTFFDTMHECETVLRNPVNNGMDGFTSPVKRTDKYEIPSLAEQFIPSLDNKGTRDLKQDWGGQRHGVEGTVILAAENIVEATDKLKSKDPT